MPLTAGTQLEPYEITAPLGAEGMGDLCGTRDVRHDRVVAIEVFSNERSSPDGGISPTLFGCEPERQGRISLSQADHVIILREWLREVVERCQPTTVA